MLVQTTAGKMFSQPVAVNAHRSARLLFNDVDVQMARYARSFFGGTCLAIGQQGGEYFGILIA